MFYFWLFKFCDGLVGARPILILGVSISIRFGIWNNLFRKMVICYVDSVCIIIHSGVFVSGDGDKFSLCHTIILIV